MILEMTTESESTMPFKWFYHAEKELPRGKTFGMMLNARDSCIYISQQEPKQCKQTKTDHDRGSMKHFNLHIVLSCTASPATL